MTKLIWLIFFLLSISVTYANECSVYGISDSPQKLNCSFKNLSLKLRCKQGSYYLNSSRVAQAFHLEVEEGAVPLVFKARDSQLTVMINSKSHIEAELLRNGRVFRGPCR